ncbi:DUF4440 domain-containing protein [Seohaeicola saemankumensis]|nr:DUF4440 domain-containing protein [Seohaeicola saemankumensis]MCA0871541.1 DUF4440 domain-containing protein [Seohaeicola saemankumensis]
MKTVTGALAAAAIAMSLTHPAQAGTRQDDIRNAHDAYVAAINSNDLNRVLATLTDDIIFIAPNTPAIEGKPDVASWVGGYFDAVATTWDKTSLEFVVAGDWAFERYAYRAVNTPRDGGAALTETGNGINIYRREADGVWRVARDVWSASPVRPLDLTCSGGATPC